MAKGEDIDQFAQTHGMAVLSIAELVEYRQRTEAVTQ